MHVCGKSKCPNRVSIGSKDDSDSISMVCVECERLYYSSEEKTLKGLGVLKLFAILVLLAIASYFLVPQIIEYVKAKSELKEDEESEKTPPKDDEVDIIKLEDSESKDSGTIAYPGAVVNNKNVIDILQGFYSSGDRKDVDKQLSFMNFDLDKYYSTGYISRTDIEKSANKYYDSIIENSATTLNTTSVTLVNVKPYYSSELDSIYTYEYSIDYDFETKKKKSYLQIDLVAKFVSINGEPKIKYIEEISRNVISEELKKDKIEDDPPIIDDEFSQSTKWYFDNDGDGFGVDNDFSFKKNEKYSAKKAGDCDDYSYTINPLIIEKCDNIDNNCDGRIDEGCQSQSDNKEIRNSSKLVPGKDSDNDGFTDAVDKCPKRKGSEVGCPIVVINGDSEITIGNSIKWTIDTPYFSNDIYNWESSDKVGFIGKNSKEVNLDFKTIGKFPIVATVKNDSQNYFESKEKIIYVRADIKKVQKWFDQLIEYGNFAGLQDGSAKLSDTFNKNALNAEEKLMELVANEDAKAVKNMLISSNLGKLIRSLKNPKLSSESKIVDFKINEFEYDEDSGLINKIHYTQ